MARGKLLFFELQCWHLWSSSIDASTCTSWAVSYFVNTFIKNFSFETNLFQALFQSCQLHLYSPTYVGPVGHTCTWGQFHEMLRRDLGKVKPGFHMVNFDADGTRRKTQTREEDGS